MAVALAAMVAPAQNNDKKDLNKEITLEKDFVPVERKATKKNTLPTVKKITPPAATVLNYSDWANPTNVPTSIPTMHPYGYRTGHNFSDKRGYLQVGAGLKADFMGSAGYRILDTEQSTLGVWVQHNSTWNGKNGSKLIPDEAQRLKQKFNDNVLGIDFENNSSAGTFAMSARGHFDSFNYYGGRDQQWDDKNKQTFAEAGIAAAWEGTPLTIKERELDYHLGLRFNHAGYDKTLIEGIKGAKENVLNFALGAAYHASFGTLGLDLEGDYINFNCDTNVPFAFDKISGYTPFRNKRNNFLFTISPYYQWQNHVFRALVGADIVLGDMNLHDTNRKFHVSPRIKLDIDIIDGAAIFVDVNGGKTLNTLSAMAAQNRYSDPTGYIFNTFSPLDGRAGFKIGPFSGFSAQIYAGYGWFKSDFTVILPMQFGASQFGFPFLYEPAKQCAASHYLNYNSRGAHFGVELNYKYRSLVEASASLQYAHVNDYEEKGKWYSGYPIEGLDGANLVADVNLRVNPIRRLALDLGLQFRSGRSYLEYDYVTIPGGGVQVNYEKNYFTDMDNLINLHAGASYRFDKVLTLWARANNLLNRRYDELPGMGAQRINFMAGVGLVF